MIVRGPRRRGFALAVLTWLAPLCAAAQPAGDRWSEAFPGNGRLDGPVRTAAEFEGELYVAGEFRECMGRRAWRVARWNGQRWYFVGGGVRDVNDSYITFALAVYDDPRTGRPTLYAAAENGLYRLPDDPNAPYDPNHPETAWPRVATTDAPIRALAVFQGALVAGGEFSIIDGQPAAGIARWDGQTWTEVGGGVGPDPAAVLALAVWDDGAGEALFAGGTFLTAGGATARRVARWDGASWTALGDGIDGPDGGEVRALVGWTGTGRLYVGGRFERAGGQPARGIAAAEPVGSAWTWSAAGDGVSGRTETVHALAVTRIDGTDTLCVGGDFLAPGQRVAAWNGATWAALGGGFADGPVYAIRAFDAGSGSDTYVVGNFTRARNEPDVEALRIARWANAAWQPLGRAPNSYTFALCGVAAWHHPRLFVGGYLQSVGPLPCGYLASWDGAAWRDLGTALPDRVYALAAFDDGRGLDLFVGGGRGPLLAPPGGADEPPAELGYIARGRMEPQSAHVWNWRWTNSADPFDANVPIACDGFVSAFTTFQGAGEAQPRLYAAGEFTAIAGRPVGYVARWDPDDPASPDGAWVAIAPDDPAHPAAPLYAFATWEDPVDGTPALVVGGEEVHTWHGGAWARILADDDTSVRALAVYRGPDDPRPTLYAGGPGLFVKYVFDEQQQAWSWITADTLDADGGIRTLLVHDDGAGEALWVGGWHPHQFENGWRCHLARWRGAWEPTSYGPGDHAYALLGFRDFLSGPEDPVPLYVAGHFVNAGTLGPRDTDSQFVGRWGRVTACRGDLNGDGTVGFDDINPFVLAITNPAGYAERYPGRAELDAAGRRYIGGAVRFCGDCNCDGEFGPGSFGDLNPFVQRLVEGCCRSDCELCDSRPEREP